MLGVTIRMGAARYDMITSDGEVVDMASMSKSERNKTRRVLVGIFEKSQGVDNG